MKTAPCVKKKSLRNCTAPEAVKTDTETPQEKPKSNMGSLMILLVLVLAGGGAALYYFKFRKPKADTTGHDDLDEYERDKVILLYLIFRNISRPRRKPIPKIRSCQQWSGPGPRICRRQSGGRSAGKPDLSLSDRRMGKSPDRDCQRQGRPGRVHGRN